MPAQLTLFGPPAPIPTPPRDIGHRRGNQSQRRAERETDYDAEAAASDAVAYLIDKGPATGESVVDHLRSIGHRPPTDKAFGPLFARLAREGRIMAAGYAKRRKGHGTSGAVIWRAV